MKKIAIAHLKGGVGKTSAAVNIAHLASLTGLRTLLVDLDAQGAAGYIFRIDTGDGAKAKAVARNRKGVSDHIFASDFPNLDLLPGSFSLRKLPQLLADEKDGVGRLGEMLKRVGKGTTLSWSTLPPGCIWKVRRYCRRCIWFSFPFFPVRCPSTVTARCGIFLKSDAARRNDRSSAVFSLWLTGDGSSTGKSWNRLSPISPTSGR